DKRITEAKITRNRTKFPEYEHHPSHTTCEVSTPENQHGTSLQASSGACSRARGRRGICRVPGMRRSLRFERVQRHGDRRQSPRRGPLAALKILENTLARNAAVGVSFARVISTICGSRWVPLADPPATAGGTD